MIKKVFKHPLFSGSALMIGGSMVVNAVNYIYHLVMGRLMGPVDYGTLGSLFSILYITTIIPISTSLAIVKFISSSKNKKERMVVYQGVKKLLMEISIIVCLLIVIFSPLIARFLHIKTILAVSSIGLIVFFSLNTLVNQATMQGLLKFIGVVGPGFVSAITKLFLGILFIFLGWSVKGAMGGVVLGAVFSYLCSRKLISNLINHKTTRKFNIKPFLKYCLPVLLQALAFTSFFTVDVLLVKHFLPAFDAGLYVALSTLGKIIYFAASPITFVMFPIVSGRRARGENYRKVFFASFGLTLLMAMTIVLFYYLFPGIAIGVLYGKAYLAAKFELVWMGLFISIYTCSYLLVNFLLSIGRTRIVVLPLMLSVVQLVGISIWHENILQVIQVSLLAMLALFMGLVLYLGYNRFVKLNAKK